MFKIPFDVFRKPLRTRAYARHTPPPPKIQNTNWKAQTGYEEAYSVDDCWHLLVILSTTGHFTQIQMFYIEYNYQYQHTGNRKILKHM